jgi:GNAT superfamily N-acetyltransferase
MPTLTRWMLESDAALIAEAFRSWNKTQAQYEKYYAECGQGWRLLRLALEEGVVVGYGNLLLESYFEPFKAQGIPEINDLNVVEKRQGQGLGRRLIAELEAEAMSRGYKQIGIGVVLHPDYARAQGLYPSLGYVQDGTGVHPTVWGDEIHYVKRLA